MRHIIRICSDVVEWHHYDEPDEGYGDLRYLRRKINIGDLVEDKEWFEVYREKIHYVTLDGKAVPDDSLDIEELNDSTASFADAHVWHRLRIKNEIEEYVFEVSDNRKPYVPAFLRELAQKNDICLPEDLDFDLWSIGIYEEARRIAYDEGGESYILENPKILGGVVIEDQILYEGQVLRI